MKKRDLISLEEVSKEELMRLLALSMEMKHDPGHSVHLLRDKIIGLVFQKPSLRTRVSFEVGIAQMGGRCVYLGPDEINLGVRESTPDVSKTLSRYLNGIVARTNSHEDLLLLAEHATVPVINGLSDVYHPCQAVADLFSIKEHFQTLEGLTIAFVGDGNNVCHSLLLGAARMGVSVNIASPAGYEPDKEVIEKALKLCTESGARIEVCRDPVAAVKGANVIYADVWISMGQEDESEKRLSEFQGYQINADLVKQAHAQYIFMHCLPAHRGEEVTAEVIDGPNSIVFTQAENRLHSQKAVLNFLFNTW